MNQEIKTEWLKRLRSGLFVQGRQTLRREREGGEEFCCLGILADIVDPKGWNDKCAAGVYFHLKSTVMPSEIVLNGAGVTFAQASLLSDKNDGTPQTERQTFAQIADYIEKQL